MKRMRNRFLAPLAFALALALAPAAFAGEAQDHVQTKHSELTTALRQPPSPARDQRVSTLLDGMVDFDKLGRESLGRHAEGRSEAQMREFQEVLQKLVRNSYEKNIEKSLNYKVNYAGEDASGDGVLVRTRVTTTKDGKEEVISIDYRLHKKNDKWMIFDIVTEDSSMVRNYRNQFNKVITRDGWDELIRKLKRKADQRDNSAAD